MEQKYESLDNQERQQQAEELAILVKLWKNSQDIRTLTLEVKSKMETIYSTEHVLGTENMDEITEKIKELERTGGPKDGSENSEILRRAQVEEIYELHNQRDTLLKEKEALSCRLDELRGIKIGYDVATQCDL